VTEFENNRNIDNNFECTPYELPEGKIVYLTDYLTPTESDFSDVISLLKADSQQIKVDEQQKKRIYDVVKRTIDENL
jgi:hypothetical protein